MSRWLITLVVLAFCCAACPGGTEGDAPVRTCEEIGQKCFVEDGKLGICTKKPDGEFQCVPQH